MNARERSPRAEIDAAALNHCQEVADCAATAEEAMQRQSQTLLDSLPNLNDHRFEDWV